jgi:hypothetical protein
MRLAATTKVLGAMKAIKMTGLTDTISAILATLRLSEIRSSRRHRILTVLQLAVCKQDSKLEYLET